MPGRPRFERSPRIPALPPRHSTWVRDCVCLAAAGVGAAALGPLVAGGVVSYALSAALVLCAVAVAWFGRRAQVRAAAFDEVVEDLCPVLGVPEATRDVLQVLRWFPGSQGVPRKLVVFYESRQALTDSTWITDIIGVFEAHGWGFYELSKLDRERRRLVFVAAEAPEPEPGDSETVGRAKRIVTQLLGPSAEVIAIDTVDAGGEVTSFEVRHELGAKLESDGYRTRIERGVGATLPGRWRARWNLHTDWVRFEQRPRFPDSVWLPVREIDARVDLLSSYDDVEIPFGVDEDGNEVVWRPAIDPNLMLIGRPGTGKTVTAHNLLVSASRYGWPVWVLDGKYIEFLGYQDWPNVQVVATTIEQQVAMLHRAHELMEFRYQKITTGEAEETDFEPVLLFLDEWAEFRGNVETWYASVKPKGGPRNPPVLDLLASMARKARTSRVHLVFGTQRPDAIYFVGDMRDNFAMRISMGRLSPQAAQMMWQSMTIGTSVPRGCRGRGTTVSDTHKPIEIQCYRVSDPRKVVEGSEEFERLEALRPTAVRHPRLLIVPPSPTTDIDATADTVEPAALTYYDYVGADWVLARNHPDLDPVVRRKAMLRSGAETGSRVASPTALLGLLDEVGELDAPCDAADVMPIRRTDEERGAQAVGLLDKLGRRTPPRARLTAVPGPATEESDPSPADPVPAGNDEDYGPVLHVRAADVELGDLLLLDDAQEWVVVDTAPEPDLVEDALLSLTWRSDVDEYGELGLPDDAEVSIRKPTSVDLAEA